MDIDFDGYDPLAEHNREVGEALELAWAAGFFEGEGSISGAWHRSKFRPQVTMPQSGSPALLEKFRDIVGIGTVTGPYDRSSNGITKQPKWQYQAYGPKALHVMELLRPFLTPGGQKLVRYEAVLSSLEAQAK